MPEFKLAPRLQAPPTKQGPHGKAWQIDLDAWRRHYGKADAGVCGWIVEAPWAHPMWHSYWLFAVHMRPVEGLDPAVVMLEGATHEVMLYALDPEATPVLDRMPQFLQPANFHGQWFSESDDAAAAKVEECVDDIINGRLSPDTDFRRAWIYRFSASNMKGPDLPPDLMGMDSKGSVTLVGTGKQNAENLLTIAAGPVPPKKEQH